jgi:hypothetical protein
MSQRSTNYDQQEEEEENKQNFYRTRQSSSWTLKNDEKYFQLCIPHLCSIMLWGALHDSTIIQQTIALLIQWVGNRKKTASVCYYNYVFWAVKRLLDGCSFHSNRVREEQEKI